MTVHCVVHRENLVAAVLGGELNSVLKQMIEIVNHIKTHPKQERLFKSFCEEMDDDYVQLLLHTKVRWLSRGNCLERFVLLYDSVKEFLRDSKMTQFLNNADNKAMIFYLADIFAHLNLLNKDLQGKKKTLLDCKTHINGFISKLKFCSAQIATKRLTRFPHLAICEPS